MSIQLSHSGGKIKGSIDLTASKSISNRVLIIKALCEGDFNIENLALAKDTSTLSNLLAGNFKTYDVGHAGTVMRFMTAFLCLKEGEYIITGSERMQQRPIKILVEALRSLGAEIECINNEGYPPLKIQGGKLLGGIVQIDGTVSSQYISALLLVAPYLKNGLTIQFKGEIISRPYINMTIEIMKYFNAEVMWEGNSIIVKQGKYIPKDFQVEADWSSASYWYGISALADEAEITLYGLNQDSLQGDAYVKEIYQQFGVQTEFIEGGIKLLKSYHPELVEGSTFEVDFSTCPDIAQTVAVTCAALNIEATFTGLKTLRIKETDRISALQIELTKLGFNIKVDGDDFIILPSLSCHPEFNRRIDKSNKIALCFAMKDIDTYDDHRMAMAFAPLALMAPININEEEVVVKSYPDFWKDLKKVGFETN